MSTATLTGQEPANAFRFEVIDAELEAAAEETAMSYTYQTAAYQMCCS